MLLAQNDIEGAACQGRVDRILGTGSAVTVLAMKHSQQINNNCQGSAEVVQLSILHFAIKRCLSLFILIYLDIIVELSF